MKTLYRHVDILNQQGIPAYAVHARRGFRCDWFENETRVRSIDEIDLDPSDVLVVPDAFEHAFQPTSHRSRLSRLREIWQKSEMPWEPCHALIEEASKIVILCLGAYYTFKMCRLDHLSTVIPYRHPRVVAALTISDDSKRYLSYAFPDLSVVKYTKPIGSEAFRPARTKRPQICFMPRKMANEATQVLSILRLRGALDGIETIPIAGMSEAQVARVMGESMVFMSFSHAEGLPRPPMEAMLSGCVVIGFHGHGGKEYMDPAFSFPIDEGDVIAYAEVTERVLNQLREDPAAFDQHTQRARDYVLENYSQAREEKEVVNFWTSLGRDDKP